MKILSKIRHSFKKPKFLKKPFLRRQKVKFDNESLINNIIFEENKDILFGNDILNEKLPINEINNNNLTIKNNTDIIQPNQNIHKSCSYVCLFIMIVFYYFSIILNKIRHQLNKTN